MEFEISSRAWQRQTTKSAIHMQEWFPRCKQAEKHGKNKSQINRTCTFDLKHENSLNSPPSNQREFGISSRKLQRQSTK